MCNLHSAFTHTQYTVLFSVIFYISACRRGASFHPAFALSFIHLRHIYECRASHNTSPFPSLLYARAEDGGLLQGGVEVAPTSLGVSGDAEGAVLRPDQQVLLVCVQVDTIEKKWRKEKVMRKMNNQHMERNCDEFRGIESHNIHIAPRNTTQHTTYTYLR